MYEAAVGESRLELAAQLAHVDIDRTVAVAQFAAPDGPVEILTGDDRSEPARHRAEQLELAHRQGQSAASGQHESLLQPDLKLAGIEDLSR